MQTMETNQTIKLIMTTYPGFHDLPKGVKKMLLVSESFFFDELRIAPSRPTVRRSLTSLQAIGIPEAATARP